MNRHDALRDPDNYRRNPMVDEIIANRNDLIDRLNNIANNLNRADDLPWDPDQLRALRDAAQRLANAAR